MRQSKNRSITQKLFDKHIQNNFRDSWNRIKFKVNLIMLFNYQLVIFIILMIIVLVSLPILIFLVVKHIETWTVVQ